MITAIILSKDKAVQLELLIKSIQKNAKNLFDIKVIYECSNGVFKQGYDKLKEDIFYKNRHGLDFPVRWYTRDDDNLSEDIISQINDDRDLTCVLNDENVFFNSPPSYKDILALFKEKPITAFSMRIGNNTIIQNAYSINDYFIHKPDEFDFILGKFIVWDGSTIKPFTNFGIPFSNNGHIYTSKLLKYILQKTNIKSIDSFEKDLQDNLHMGEFGGLIPPYMACLENSVVINNSSNKISDKENVGFGNSNYELNERYLSGLTIDYDFFNFEHVSKPFQDFITRFHREDYMQYGR
tara:strand:- start:4044 stop:4928 length:885 start_codon:yes stop_codon:yes gene_type:complete